MNRMRPDCGKGGAKPGRHNASYGTAGILLCLVFWAGCGLFSPRSSVSPSVPAVARLDNGYLLELPAGGNQPLVEALATRGRWVIVTVVDPAYDLAPFRQVSSPFVDSVEIARFPSAVQLSFRFREDILQVSVASQPSDPSILISVFTR